jgi:hypothetical protein
MLLTSAAFPGNWKNFNGYPGDTVTRARYVDLSANPASAGVGYEIFNLPSFTFLKGIWFVKVSGCSSDDAEIQLGDENASQRFNAEISMSTGTAWYTGTRIASYASANQNVTYYHSGGQIQFACSASQAQGAFWVVIETINLKPLDDA